MYLQRGGGVADCVCPTRVKDTRDRLSDIRYGILQTDKLGALLAYVCCISAVVTV